MPRGYYRTVTGCRMVTCLVDVVWEFVLLVKEAMFTTKVNVFILGSFLGKLCWLIPLVSSPRLFQTFPEFYRPFQRAAPQDEWVAAALALLAFDVFSARHVDMRWQAAGLFAGFWTWWFLSAMTRQGLPVGAAGLPSGPTYYFYLVGALVCVIGLLRLTVEYGAYSEAHGMLRLRRIIEEELHAGRMADVERHPADVERRDAAVERRPPAPV